MPTRAIRFTEEENNAIKEFLKLNPYFDFTTVAKMAILNFIQNPSLNLQATKIKNQKSKERSLQ